MAENAPLHRHPDLLADGQRAMLNVDFRKMEASFEVAKFDPAKKEGDQFLVNELVNRNYVLQILEDVRRLLAKSLDIPESKIECPALDNPSNARAADTAFTLTIIGMENTPANRQKFSDAIANIAPEIDKLLAGADLQENQAVAIAADRFLDICPMEQGWKPGMNAERAMENFMELACDQGLDLEREELARSLAAHINELLEEGRQLSPEQNDFMEYMRENGEVQRLDVPSPIRMRPQPGARM